MSANNNLEPLKTIRIPDKELRQKYNEGNFWERSQSGEFTRVPLSFHIPASPKEPLGTRSVIFSLRDSNGEEWARVHLYLRPDGSFGGSGKPDPKIVREGDTLYMQERKKKP
jgi:hypothetical protein